MPQYRAGWLLPISQPPIRDAWLRTEQGRIVAFGHSRPGDFTASDEIDLGHAAVLPGLVNVHTHLELSWMRGRIPETDDFPAWIRSVLALGREAKPGADEVARAIAETIDEARAFGTAVVGDISNSLASSPVLAAQDMPAVVFHELIGFRSADAGRIVAEAIERLRQLPESANVRHTLAPHAPYSVSPALFGAIRTALQQTPLARSSLHLGESTAEMEFLRDGTGPWRELLETMDTWDPSWVVPKCSPVDYVHQMACLDERLLVVHGVQLGESELKRLAAAGATLVTCPRGNVRTGAGEPPIDEFFESGARVAVGTDSLASVPDLNLFSELAEMRRLAPVVPARLLLESATAAGARALGFESDFGTIEAGKRDRLISVDLDGYVPNVEEYLVSGIDASRIRWLTSQSLSE
ncbi:MAG TPA: amidohydrolase family protein [Vicinamibacterales bacterium]|nr:amidohydrolase family protein [Vicinamibacterales bacterium]